MAVKKKTEGSGINAVSDIECIGCLTSERKKH